MDDIRMPVIFAGHGSPMTAMDKNDITAGMRAVGESILQIFGKPKAILSISAHWVTEGTYVQGAAQPRQVYDFQGFPEELTKLEYPVTGCGELTRRVRELLGDKVSVNDDWGIDHGTWSVLIHMFPRPDIPVVQLSVNSGLTARECFALGQSLAQLRSEGYLILGSGNVVYDPAAENYEAYLKAGGNREGSQEAVSFNNYICRAVEYHHEERAFDWEMGPNSEFAVPTVDHYWPLLYTLGAADGDDGVAVNRVFTMGSVAMTMFAFGMFPKR
jgi:4,5-DOPA dioxygenase extradiol